jgi:hypothetical protein
MSLPDTANGSKYLDMLINSELRQQIIVQLLAFATDKPYCAVCSLAPGTVRTAID